MQRSGWLTAAAALAGLLMVVPATASADTYSVLSCREPLGLTNAAAGWVGSQSGTGVFSNSCPSGGALSAVLPDANPPGGAGAAWRFTAPVGTRIVRFAAVRTTQGLKPSSQPKDLAYVLETDGATLEDCSPSTQSSCVADLAGPVDKQGLDGGFVQFRAGCTNFGGGACTGPLRVDATQLDVGLRDTLAPTVRNARLRDDGGASGTLSVGFDATDAGGGLYRAIVKVDGKQARAIGLAAAPCADVAPADQDPYEFNVPVPCPGTISDARVMVDSTSLPAGPHGVEVAVEDAAGNETAVWGPVEFPSVNSGSSTPAAALHARLRMWFVKAPNRGRSYTSRFGTRVVTRGVLRDLRGRGIRGARVDVYHVRRGKRRLIKTGLKTREGGKLTLILPLNVDTREIQYAYRALRPGPITSRQTLHLTVLDSLGRVFHRKR